MIKFQIAILNYLTFVRVFISINISLLASFSLCIKVGTATVKFKTELKGKYMYTCILYQSWIQKWIQMDWRQSILVLDFFSITSTKTQFVLSKLWCTSV